MAYSPLSLGEVVQQAGAIKGQQQRAQLSDLALQQGQTQLANEQGIQSTLATNPNASLADLSKYGLQGVQASTQLSAAQMADLTNQYRKTYQAATAVVNSDDPVATVHQVAPEFAQQYDRVHGQGAFDKLASDPNQVKAQAQIVLDHAMAGLVDPDKQFQAHAEMIKAHFTQGEETKRADANRAAEDARSAAGRAVTIRGQDLEAGRSNKPQLVEVPNADGTTTKKWLIPGQLEGPTVGTSPPGAKLSETQGNAKAFGLRAQDANATLEAMMTGPNAYNPTGIAAAKDAAAAGGAANFLASDAGQKYQNVAKAFIAPILRKESGAAISESEWKSAKQLYIPIPGDSSTVLEQKARNRADAIEGLKVQAGPTGLPDVKSPTGSTPTAAAAPATPKPGALVKGYRFKGGDPSRPESWVKASG
jgi:hypothetical protein